MRTCVAHEGQQIPVGRCGRRCGGQATWTHRRLFERRGGANCNATRTPESLQTSWGSLQLSGALQSSSQLSARLIGGHFGPLRSPEPFGAFQSCPELPSGAFWAPRSPLERSES
eukprot:1210343-Alexandrium_andersonii.AAC.1